MEKQVNNTTKALNRELFGKHLLSMAAHSEYG